MLPSNLHCLIGGGVIYDRLLTDEEFSVFEKHGLPEGWQAVHLELPISPTSPKVWQLLKRDMAFWDGVMFPWKHGDPFPVQFALAGVGIEINISGPTPSLKDEVLYGKYAAAR